MFYRMITEARDRWYASPDCTVGPVIEYIVQKGELRGPQIEAIKTYFKGVRTEWTKVSWPERRQVVTETISVIVIVFVFTVAIYLMDLLFKGLLSLIK